MTTYAVHLPVAAKPGTQQGLERTVLVKDSFHWLAFLFPLIWLVVHRCWLATVFYIVASLAMATGGAAAGLGRGTVAALEFVLNLAIGFSAADLFGWALARRGFRLADVVTAPRRDEAERRFFARWLAAAPGSSGTGPAPGRGAGARPPYPVAQSEPSVLGLFPMPGGRP